jgi:holo-[acyl-carrier protein] synthase
MEVSEKKSENKIFQSGDSQRRRAWSNSNTIMIKVGTDIVKISRLNDRFSKKILGLREMEIYNSLKTDQRKREFLAGRFAVKESFVKATGNKALDFKKINILIDKTGEPYPDADTKKMFNDYEISLSISHEKDYVIAIVILNMEAKL